MEDNGYDDPAELFKEGKWNWDTFTEMCLDFTDAESDKYALDGWYYEKLCSSLQVCRSSVSQTASL